MIVNKVISDLLSSNMYFIIEEGRAIVVDPCRNTKLPPGVIPELIFLTHEHYDHISGVNAWKDKYSVSVLSSELCYKRIQNAKLNMSRYFESFIHLQDELCNDEAVDYDPCYRCRADWSFATDFSINWRGHGISFFVLPGHSPGSAAMLIDNCLFSGDSLFVHKSTEVRFPGGSATEWTEYSLPKLLALSPDTQIFPGHFSSFCLKDWPMFREK